jgi:hypothetical protein
LFKQKRELLGSLFFRAVLISGTKVRIYFNIIHFIFKEMQTGALLSLLKWGKWGVAGCLFHGIAGKNRVILR